MIVFLIESYTWRLQLSISSFLKKILKPAQNFSFESEECISLKNNIAKIEYDIATQNGLEHYQFNSVKIDGNNDVLVIIVGYNGSVNGYENKYFKIAKRANEIYGSTVFIVDNNERNWYSPKNYFKAIMHYVKENTINSNIKIKLFGISAGATLALYYAWEYTEINNLLLVNPPLIKENIELTINGMKLFTGNSTLVIGQNDPSYEFGKLFYDDRSLNIFNNVILFDNADHNFKGLLNEFINLPFLYLFRISLSI